MKAISVQGLVKEFQSKQKKKFKQDQIQTVKAVNHISLEVESGEIFGFLGPNGAGKTTTIRMLIGILKPTEGTISIFGINLLKNPIQAKEYIGNVPDMANSYIDLSGLENLIFIGEIFGLSKNDAENRANVLLKTFQLFEKRYYKAMTYSKGMQQRLLLAMALMNRPRLLFLDEPTAGLDLQSSIIIQKNLKQYNQEGMTIFLTTHDMEIANKLCHRIAIIKQGSIVSIDTPYNLQSLIKNYQAIDCEIKGEILSEELSKLSSIQHIERNNQHFRFIMKDLQKGIYEIINFFQTKNVSITQFNIFTPKLENVFLKIIEGGNTN